MKNNKKDNPVTKTAVDPIKDDSIVKSRTAFKNWMKERIIDITSYLVIDFVSILIKFEDDNKENRQGAIFRSYFLKPYRQMVIKATSIAMEMFKNGEFDELNDGLIHELCHIHTIPLGDMAKYRFITDGEITDAGEELTETMVRYVKKIIDMSKRLKEEYPFKKNITIR